MVTKPFPKLRSKAVLSPMSGVTDVAFRALCRRYGAALTYTEFVSSTAIVRGNIKTLHMLKVDASELPVAVQLFGSSVEDVVNAAHLLEDKFDIIDINCGCPAWKVIKTGAGSELLKKPDGIADFVRKIVSKVSKPVTIKIRKGIDEKHTNAIEIAKKAEEAGAATIAIHGRTQKQGYSGTADWDIIREVKQAVHIPVIGNGDVFTPEDFKKRLEESGVDYIMIARGAMGNPYIFRQINDYIEKGSYDTKDKLEQFAEYLVLAEHYELAFSHVKQQASYFTKGIVGGAEMRKKIVESKNIQELKEIMRKR